MEPSPSRPSTPTSAAASSSYAVEAPQELPIIPELRKRHPTPYSTTHTTEQPTTSVAEAEGKESKGVTDLKDVKDVKGKGKAIDAEAGSEEESGFFDCHIWYVLVPVTGVGSGERRENVV
ncbi:hypothetical protein BT69DRAFT_64389 [Atractiella rhizophila]|nr:hypothetical protein BT69DRAFT_64389 [Atractiella rhizophila]